MTIKEVIEVGSEGGKARSARTPTAVMRATPKPLLGHRLLAPPSAPHA